MGVAGPGSGCAGLEKWPSTGPIDGLDKRWRAWRAKGPVALGRPKAKLKNLQQALRLGGPSDSS